MNYFRWRHLRNLMILTVQAAEITARTGYRQARGAGMEVVERLLLNGVYGQRTRPAVYLADKHAIHIPSTPADTRLSIRNLAMVGTEQTLHPSIIQPLIVFALHQNTIAS